MTIDKAIRHCEEVAEEHDRHLKVYESMDEDRLLFREEENECKNCGKEHEQFAGWLEELKELRNMTAGHLYAVAFNRGYLKAKKEVREKTIDDFVENISLEISESIIWAMLVNSHKGNSFNDT